MSFIRPCKTSNTSDNFSDHKKRGSNMPGLDFTTPVGEKVWASRAGVVTRADTYSTSAMGKNVRISHPDGTTSYYLHLSRVDVRSGQHVKSNQVIGLSGNTGQSSGPHLHFSIANANGVLMDPQKLISSPRKPTESARVIRLGSYGPEVKYLQKKLGLKIIGIFGRATKKTVVKFQKENDLVADGVVNQATWKAIG